MSNETSVGGTVGFIGLGLMGRGMAKNLAQVGFNLVVYNRTREKAAAFVREFDKATVAETPRAVAESSPIVITMVSDVPDVEEVYFGENGIFHAARPPMLCIDMGTVGAKCAQSVAERLAEKNITFVDAPVSGGSWGAEQGTLSIMAGGAAEDFQRALPLFEAMGKKIVHCGPVGMGQTVKLVNQVVGAVNLHSMAEGVLLAQAAGAPFPETHEAVGAGAAGSWAWQNLAPRANANDFAPGFKVAHQVKDLRLALEAATEAGIDLPGTRLVLGYLEGVMANGGGENGTQSLIGALRG